MDDERQRDETGQLWGWDVPGEQDPNAWGDGLHTRGDEGHVVAGAGECGDSPAGSRDRV